MHVIGYCISNEIDIQLDQYNHLAGASSRNLGKVPRSLEVVARNWHKQ